MTSPAHAPAKCAGEFELKADKLFDEGAELVEDGLRFGQVGTAASEALSLIVTLRRSSS